MINKETPELIVEAINYYIENGLCPEDKRPSIDIMRKIVKFDDIKTGLQKQNNEQ